MKKSYLALGTIGILFILFGTIFALQGNGNIGGSAMSGNSFWIYAGSGVVVVGSIMAFLGFNFGTRKRTSVSAEMKETPPSSQTKK